MTDKELEKFMETHRAEVLDELRRSSVLRNPEDAVDALEYSVKTLKNISKRMSEESFVNLGPEKVGQTAAYVAKVVNEVWRLIDFARGKADHRTEVTGIGELMKVLTNEQFEQVNKWYEEGLGRDAEGRGPH